MTLPQTQLQNQVNQQLQNQVNQMANSSSFFNKVVLHQQHLYPNNVSILCSSHQWNFPIDGFLYIQTKILLFLYIQTNILLFLYIQTKILDVFPLMFFIYPNKHIDDFLSNQANIKIFNIVFISVKCLTFC
ncbi:MAG: hypothetical protein IJE50_06030 [Clostridia bacterium]|nr:hypothetical protein [Clostridia bacterium]